MWSDHAMPCTSWVVVRRMGPWQRLHLRKNMIFKLLQGLEFQVSNIIANGKVTLSLLLSIATRRIAVLWNFF